MLDPKLVRQSLDDIANRLAKRGMTVDVKTFHDLENQRKELQVEMQALQHQRNTHSKEVGKLKASGKNVDHLFEELKNLSDSLKKIEETFNGIHEKLDNFLARLPNLPHESVPVGITDTDNKEVRQWGKPTKFSYQPKDHVALGEQNGWIDFETAAKISGARFVVLRGPLAKLQRALIQFMLDVHTTENGYQEISVPYLVHEDCLFGTGQLPKMKEDVFRVDSEHGLYLIPTAEVPVTNTVRDQIIEISDLPIKYVCYSSCFRSEAGSYGKDMKGMLRQHQFEKVELVQLTTPDKSYQALEELTYHAENILQKLELPYRVMSLCTADLSFSSAKTYDLEVWLPGQNRYREVSSCSNMESFQARRMKARYRDETTSIDFIHTLNGSALAVGRTMIAIIENYQDELGRIHIPTLLQKYMDGITVIEAGAMCEF